MVIDINLKRMRKSADQAVDLMKVLGNRDRMMLLCEINQGERCVTELETLLTIRREGKQLYSLHQAQLPCQSWLCCINIIVSRWVS